MFSYHVLQSEEAKNAWKTIRDTISPEEAQQASEKIGRLASEDMLDFSTIDKSEVDALFVKYRDGVYMVNGMKEIFPSAEAVYLITERYGSRNQNVSVEPFNGYDFGEYNRETAWFVDPVVARGTTVNESIRFLRKRVPSERLLLSNIVANIKGIKNIQTKITSFDKDGYMNYAYQSTKLNEKTGFLEDGLRWIPDYGDKVEGTWGEDFPLKESQNRFRNIWYTDEVGKIERTRATLLYVLQAREAHKTDRKLKWSTTNWIRMALIWLKVYRNLDIETSEKAVARLLKELQESGFITPEKRVWKDRFAYTYSITDEGAEYSTSILVPVMAEEGWTHQIEKDLDHLCHLTPHKLKLQVNEGLKS